MYDELSTDEERRNRVAKLGLPQVAPLSRLVRRIRDIHRPKRQVPDFDPLDGGVMASVLFLLEAPGPRAIATGFVSRDNPDPTARNMRALLTEAGIPRDKSVLWNIIPWYLGDTKRIRPAKTSDLPDAIPYLAALLVLLSELKAVVLVGKKAQVVESVVAGLVTNATVIRAYHPSQRVLNIDPRKRSEILAQFRRAAEVIQRA